MKKILLSVCACLCWAGTMVAQTVAQSVAGRYSGDLYISPGAPVPDDAEPMPGQSIEMKAGEAEGTVDFYLYNFSFGDLVLGDISLPGIGVSTSDSTVLFAEKAPDSFTFLPETPMEIQATAALNATTSYVEGKNIMADIDVVWINGGNLPIFVRFVGVKTTEQGVSAAPSAEREQIIYTLDGRRVNGALNQQPRGIYIVNGKKIVK